MSRWFRSYADKHRNTKVARLSDSDFRLWDQLLCVAAENDGEIPPLEDLKHLLKRRLDHLSKGLKRLVNGGLIEPLNNGYTPHGWDERQYKSDSSTERVQKHRAKRNVSRNVSETPPDTDTDTDKEKPPSKAPPCDQPDRQRGEVEFAYFGKTIRLNESDLGRWRQRYHAVSDIEAELGSLDDWLQGQPEETRKKWFHIVSGSLNKKHQAALQADNDDSLWPGGMNSPC